MLTTNKFNMKANNVLLTLLFLGSSSLLAQETLDCNIAPTRNGFEWIENVKIGSLDYTSGKSGTRTDDSSEQISLGNSLEAGDVINIELTPGYKKRQYEEYWRVWIDLDKDNFFSNNEIVFEQKGKGTISGSFIVPEGGDGDSKVKVAMNWKSYPNCKNHTSGEIEYYYINLKPSVSNSADFSFHISIPLLSTMDQNANINIPGNINNSNHKIEFNIPYTNGSGTYSAFVGDYVLNNHNTGQNGDVNAFRISYPQGTFSASGSIPVTIEVDGDGSFEAKQISLATNEALASLEFIINGKSEGHIKMEIIGGIPDRNFSDPHHKFIYTTITAPDGKVWLNNNLGSNYSNMNHTEFNPQKSAQSTADYNAYGSLFQWGRFSDGHELMDRTATGTTPVNNSITHTVSPIPTPGHNHFIVGPNFTSSEVNLWNGINGVNNPCPVGFRIPNQTEINSLAQNPQVSDIIKSLTFGNHRNRVYGTVAARSFGYYLGINTTNNTSSSVRIYESNNEITNWSTNESYYGYGMSVRCIKDDQVD